ncbi:MAG: hypothetical protein CMB80_05690 [Flammeovirgaceae bacterium]|nr:hypothetical protein [Flammeovirgaceae bacterium]|tara:strand:- start:43 stop:489 length:447 start_codon:yes stop_codon:yes gene_type:complete
MNIKELVNAFRIQSEPKGCTTEKLYGDILGSKISDQKVRQLIQYFMLCSQTDEYGFIVWYHINGLEDSHLQMAIEFGLTRNIAVKTEFLYVSDVFRNYMQVVISKGEEQRWVKLIENVALDHLIGNHKIWTELRAEISRELSYITGTS